MNESILAQLKKPTKPTTQRPVSIQYQKPESQKDVKIDVKIVDTRPTSKDDATKRRTELLNQIKNSLFLH